MLKFHTFNIVGHAETNPQISTDTYTYYLAYNFKGEYMIIKTFVLIQKENRYLLIKEASKKWEGKWFIPGGTAKHGEKPEHAAHRETKEEAGCDININGIFYIKYTDGIIKNSLSVFYAATIAGEETLKQFPDKHSLDVKWFTYEEIKSLPTREKLLSILNSFQKEKLIPVENFTIVL